MTTLQLHSHPTLVGRVLSHNPFYLLSALCMLAGCVALTNSLSFSPLHLARLTLLIATLNLYEILLVGLGLFLIVQRNLLRDGSMLLCLEAAFIADAAFLNAEIFAADVLVGLIVNVMLMGLVIAKLAAVFWALGLPLRGGIFALVVGQLAFLYAIPGVFRAISQYSDGALSPLVVYAAWWAVALLPILLSLVLRRRAVDPTGTSPAHRYGSILAVFLVVPMISIIVHLCTQNWVYNVRWYTANSTPLVLGLAVAIGMYDRHVSSLAMRMRVQLLLPLVAILGALATPGQLVFTLGGVTFTPLRLTLLATALVYAHGLWLHRHLHFAWAGGACLALAGLGESPAGMLRNMYELLSGFGRQGERLMPQSRIQWGIAAVATSFILLIVGALVSLLRPKAAAPRALPVDEEDSFM